MKKQVTTPKIEGLTITEATKVLKELNLEMQIKNEPEEYDKQTTVIKEQLPKQGISVYEGTKIIVEI